MFLLAWISNSLIRACFCLRASPRFCGIGDDRVLAVSGFTFEVAREVLKTLQEKYPGLLSDREPNRLIFVKESQAGDSKLVEFDVGKVVAAWAEGKFVVPVWLDVRCDLWAVA
ncbi:hypothetical protein QUB29_03245 [Microcoleus sp. B4b_D2]|jgi:acyl CoA:acetate/3-ketoacid CoA transferase|uniref:hypothetical protein n=1 Tax=unclassified Microcoleus TaxID=2642155 RepID=UPI002FD57844